MGSNLVRDSAFDSSFLGAKWPECNPFYDGYNCTKCLV